jgi:hypothetical protein
MSQKSILEQALLQMENFEEAIKQNSKGILSSTMKKEFKNLLESKEEQNEQEVDDETTPDEDEKDVPEVGDETMNDTDEDSSEDEMSDDEDEMSDDEMGMTEPQDDSSDDTLDMTGASDSEVLRVFKSMKPEDGIVVKKDGNNLEIEVSGDEYIIKLDELDEDLSEEEMTEEETSEEEMTEEETSEEETSEEEMTEEETSEEEETVYEIELDEESTEDEKSSKKETKESKVKKGEHTEAARTKWNPHGDKGESKRAGLKSKKVFKAGSGVVSEEFIKLKKQNEEYKKALILFKDKLNEVAVFNANLAYATRIFTEHSTTKQEKLNILKRFDSVSTMNESKNLFSTIKSELENKKPISESVVDKITSTSKTSSSKDILSESNAYVSPQFARMKDLMKKLK